MKLKEMKMATSMAAVVVLLCCTLPSSRVMAQDSLAIARKERARVDSVSRAQEIVDSDNLSDLKSERIDTRAKARKAERVQREANDAARESKLAYQSEKRAQKARKKADKQARKASKARDKSDDN